MKFFLSQMMILSLVLIGSLMQKVRAEDANRERVKGVQRVAVILLDLAQDGKEPAAEDFRKAMFDSEFSIDQFVQEASYGKASLAGSVFGWIPVSGRNLPCEPSEKQSFAYAGDQIPFENFDRVIFLHHVDAVKCAGTGLGESGFGKHLVKTPHGKLLLSVASLQADNRFVKPVLPFQKLSGITSGVLAHELGHSFGIYGHGNILSCGARAVSDQKSAAPACEQSALADRMSIMGGEGFYRPALHWSACHKEDLGWLDEGELVSAPSELLTKTPLKIKIFPFASRDSKGKPVAIKINLENPIWVASHVSISALYIEYRTAIGFDRRLKEFGENPGHFYPHLQSVPAPANSDLKIAAEGLQVRGGFFNQGHCTTTYLLDAHPNSLSYGTDRYSLYDHLDGNLTTGEGMTEPNNGIRMEAGEIQKDGSIEVSLFKN